ncbi:MAG TPA: hypothetical protein VF521_11705, partial [Pyrinomonadaceae bacterium]
MAGKRQRIVDAVKARFATITVANGYQTDIGLKQTEWNPGPRGADEDSDELPGHDIRDEDETADIPVKNAGTYTRFLEVVALGYVRETADGAATTRKALEDMIRAVGKDPTWGGLARRTLPDTEGVAV